jgi:hypothetical protein
MRSIAAGQSRYITQENLPKDGFQFAPGYCSILFEDPDGIRIEVNYFPHKGHIGDQGRLGPEGSGTTDKCGADGPQ